MGSKGSDTLSPDEPFIPALESLDEICEWLGTFRERLRLARSDEREHFEFVIGGLEEKFRKRRAELS